MFEGVVYFRGGWEKAHGCKVVIDRLSEAFKKEGVEFEIVDIEGRFTPYAFNTFRVSSLSILNDRNREIVKEFRGWLGICHPYSVLLMVDCNIPVLVWNHGNYIYGVKRELFNFRSSFIEREMKMTYTLLELAKMMHSKLYLHCYFEKQMSALSQLGWDTEKMVKVSGFAWKDNFPKSISDVDSREFDVFMHVSPFKVSLSEIKKVAEILVNEGLRVCIKYYGYSNRNREKIVEKLKTLNVELVLDRLEYGEYMDLLNSSKVFLYLANEDAYGIRIFEAIAFMPMVSLTHYPWYDFDIKVNGLEEAVRAIRFLLDNKERWYRQLERGRSYSAKEDFETLRGDVRVLVEKFGIEKRKGKTKKMIQSRLL